MLGSLGRVGRVIGADGVRTGACEHSRGSVSVTDLRRASNFAQDVVIIGGCGDAGLPLAIALADRGASVAIYDTSEPAVAAVNSAVLPFTVPGARLPLQLAIGSGRLPEPPAPVMPGTAEHVIVV